MKTQYAQVIVDVATMQTNQPYTYVIPPELAGQVEAGMRVVVGFGRGKRRVQNRRSYDIISQKESPVLLDRAG